MAEQKTALQPKPMAIHTCYVVDIKSQLVTEKGEVTGSHKVDESIMHATRKVCLDALKFCAELFLKEWDSLKGLQFLEMKRRCDVLIHTTKASTSKYAFDGSGTTNTVTKSITTVYVSSRTGRYTTVISMHRITSWHGSSSGSMRSWMAARNSLRCRCVHWIPF